VEGSNTFSTAGVYIIPNNDIKDEPPSPIYIEGKIIFGLPLPELTYTLSDLS
jgi:hypothetical protein